jgi:hypothetical protein
MTSAAECDRVESPQERVPPLVRRLVDRLLGTPGGLLAADFPTDCPAEFIPIAAVPLDGHLVGIVRHPGLPWVDPPLASFEPESLVATYFGADARRGAGVLLGVLLADALPAHRAAVEAVADEFGFDPAQLPSELPLGVLPRVPPGWRLAPTDDGLGVLAPSAQFAGEQLFHDETTPSLDADAAVTESASALSRGYPATALWLLRNAAVYAEPVERAQLLDRMTACHDAIASAARTR